eukprot:12425719-Alexandrium_andersonii.AAC.1
MMLGATLFSPSPPCSAMARTSTGVASKAPHFFGRNCSLRCAAGSLSPGGGGRSRVLALAFALN